MIFTFFLAQEKEGDDAVTRKRSKHALRKVAARKSNAKVDPRVEEQFLTGRLYGE